MINGQDLGGCIEVALSPADNGNANQPLNGIGSTRLSGDLGGTLHEVMRLIVLTALCFPKLLYIRFFLDVALREAEQGRLILAYLLRMGPLYIKAGQILATQAGWLSADIRQQLRSLFSNVPVESPESIAQLLKDSYGDQVHRYFTSFDYIPKAAGSVAQVHVAQLHGGQKVAVKVVRPGVRTQLYNSVHALLILAHGLHWLVPSLRQHRLPTRIKELIPCILDQADMRVELRHQQAVIRNFRNHPYLRVPTPLEGLSRDNILVMDYVEGTHGEHFAELNVDRTLLASRLQDIFYTMVFFHGAYHLDPHPGNFVFADTGEITLLDFGLMGYVTEQEKWKLSAFYFACVRKEWNLAVQRFTDCFVQTPHRLQPAPPAYLDAMTTVLRKHFETRSARWSTMAFIDDAIQVLTQHREVLATRFSQLALAFLTGEGFVCLIDPKIDIWSNARRFTDRASPYVSDAVKDKFDRYFAAKIPKTIQKLVEVDRYFVAPTHLHRYILPSTYPLIIDRASGCRLRDIDDNEYLDLSNGYGPHILGYGSALVRDATSSALQAGNVNALANNYELRFAERLAQAFAPESKVILANSGTESVLMAIRLARTYTGRPRCAKFEGHYHGFSDQGLVSSWFSFAGTPDQPEPTQGCPGSQSSVVDETVVLQYGNDSSFEIMAKYKDELACVICEPMPGGLAYADSGFLQKLRHHCDRYGIVLIFDEVVTGFRVTYGGVQHLVQVWPDLTCLGKIIGGTLPCGAVVGKPEIVNCAKTSKDPFIDAERKTFVGGTLSGNALTSAAGLAVLGYLNAHPELYHRLDRMTESLTEKLKATAAVQKIPYRINGQHSIFSMTFDYHSPKYIRDRHAGTNFKANIALSYYMRKQNVYMPELHTMMLSAAHGDNELDEIDRAFSHSLQEMKQDGLFSL